MSLLNEAREITEQVIDVLHEPQKGKRKKVRTYRQKARKNFLAVSKTGRPSGKKIRKGIKKQIQYVARNLSHIEKLSGSCEEPGDSPLSY